MTGQTECPTAQLAQRRQNGALTRVWRRHWPFVLLLLAGAVLRLAVSVAMSPALMFMGDSYDYIQSARSTTPGLFHPFGYSALLRSLMWTNDLRVVTTLQHLMGLGLGVVTYAVLRRLGVRRWLSVVAAAPVLLDAYQVIVEQFVLAEVLFELLLLVGIALLLARHRPALGTCAAVGVLVAAAGLTRPAGFVMLLPCLGLIAVRRWGWQRLLAPTTGALIVIGSYAVWFHDVHARHGVESFSGRLVYGRVAPFADCGRLELSEIERRLCDPRPIEDRPAGGGIHYTWDFTSPLYQLPVPVPLPLAERLPARTADDVAQDFALAVVLGQPGDYLKSLAQQLAVYFGPGRSTNVGRIPNTVGMPVQTWQFHEEINPGVLNLALGEDFRSAFNYPDMKSLPLQRPGSLAGWLRTYQKVAYMPGSVLGGGFLVSLIAVIGWPRRGELRQRFACALLACSGLLLILVPAATVSFDYRYLLPAAMLLVPASALAVEILLRLHGHPSHGRISSDMTKPPVQFRSGGTASSLGERMPEPTRQATARMTTTNHGAHPPRGAHSLWPGHSTGP